MRHFEVELQVLEDVDVLHVDRGAEHRVAFLGEAGAHAQHRAEEVGRGQAPFEVHPLAAFGVFVDDVDEGDFGLGLEGSVEAAPEEGDVQVRGDLVAVLGAHEHEAVAVGGVARADRGGDGVLDGDADLEEADLGVGDRVPAHAEVDPHRQFLVDVELVDLEDRDVHADGQAVQHPVGVAEHVGVFGVGVAVVDRRAVFEEADPDRVVVVDGIDGRDEFLAGFAAEGAEQADRGFELVGLGDPRGVDVHRGVLAELAEPVVLLVLVGAVDRLGAERARGEEADRGDPGNFRHDEFLHGSLPIFRDGRTRCGGSWRGPLRCCCPRSASPGPCLRSSGGNRRFPCRRATA